MNDFAYIDFDLYLNSIINYDIIQVQKKEMGIISSQCDEVKSFVKHELIACIKFSNYLDDYERNILENLINEI